MAVNNFLPFAPTDTGTNLLSQADYAVASDRTIGNQPGVASSKLVNKAIRQSAYITSQIAQLVSDQLGADVLDDSTPLKLLAQLKACLSPLTPTYTKYTSGSGNHNLTYSFFIVSGNATAGATYTNNGFTYTVSATIAAGVKLVATGTGVPAVSGTLTKASGTGDATLSFYAFRMPLYLKVRMVGGGGGGGPSGTSSGTIAVAGGSTTFGSSLLTCGGGNTGVFGGGSPGGAGGTATIGAGASGIALTGGKGAGAPVQINSAYTQGTAGGMSFFGGIGASAANTGGLPPVANTGSGGPGGGTDAVPGSSPGGGGGSGGFIEASILSPASVYAYAVGTGGTGATAGPSGFAGGAGASGVIEIMEYYQ